jgi:hypothetical protein
VPGRGGWVSEVRALNGFRSSEAKAWVR